MTSLLHLEFVLQHHKLQPQDLEIVLLKMTSVDGTILRLGMLWMNLIGRENQQWMEDGKDYLNLTLICMVFHSRFPLNDHTTGNDDGFYMQMATAGPNLGKLAVWTRTIDRLERFSDFQ